MTHGQLAEKAGLDVEHVRMLLNIKQRMRPIDARKLFGALRQNEKVSGPPPLTPELKQDANPPFAAPLGWPYEH